MNNKSYPEDVTKRVVQALRDWADHIEKDGNLIDADGSGDNEVIVRPDGSIRPGPRIRRVFVFTYAGTEPAGEGEQSNWDRILKGIA